MPAKPYFTNIKQQIIKELNYAEKSIWVAMAWLTDREIFDVLCQKALDNIDVKLILLHDEINLNSSVDYGTLINAGGQFLWSKNNVDKEKHQLHTKFCIIDSKTVLTGSYNWTYRAHGNNEDMVVHKDEMEFATYYLNEFKQILFNNLSSSKEIFNTINLINKSVNYEEAKKLHSSIKLFKSESNLRELPKLIPYRKKDKWGYCDKYKNIIIDCIYDETWPFSEGLAHIKLNEKYGFIDESGIQIIPLIYDYCISFRNGVADVKKNGEETKIDKNGIELYPYTKAYQRTKLIETVDDLIWILDNEKWGLVDKKKNIIIPFVYDNIRILKNGLAWVKKNNKWGLIDKNQNKLISPIYDDVGYSNFGCWVKKNDKWGMIDIFGSVLFPFIYDNHSYFSEDLIWVEKNKKWGALDKSGKEVITFIYDYGFDFSEGLAKVEINGKWGYIDKHQNVIIPFIFDDCWQFIDGLAWVEINHKSGYIDYKGIKYWED